MMNLVNTVGGCLGQIASIGICYAAGIYLLGCACLSLHLEWDVLIFVCRCIFRVLLRDARLEFPRNAAASISDSFVAAVKISAAHEWGEFFRRITISGMVCTNKATEGAAVADCGTAPAIAALLLAWAFVLGLITFRLVRLDIFLFFKTPSVFDFEHAVLLF